jgi:hypothetical protein
MSIEFPRPEAKLQQILESAQFTDIKKALDRLGHKFPDSQTTVELINKISELINNGQISSDVLADEITKVMGEEMNKE